MSKEKKSKKAKLPKYPNNLYVEAANLDDENDWLSATAEVATCEDGLVAVFEFKGFVNKKSNTTLEDV